MSEGHIDRETILFLGTAQDKEYIPRLKGLVGAASVFVITDSVSTLTQVELYCKAKNVTGVITTNTTVLRKLLEAQGKNFGAKEPALDNYAGSYIKHNGLEYVFIDPLKQLVTVNHGKFMAARYISKLSAPSAWSHSPKFNWKLIDGSNVDAIYLESQSAFAMAVDIETFSSPPSIRCFGFTTIHLLADGSIQLSSYVLPLESMWSVTWMRKFCLLEVPKIFQNGKYDISYLAMYRSPISHWFWDTVNMMHAWYSELPKDLAFITSFFVREAMYWKDLADTNDLHEYYRYNALDTWGTANVFIQWMLQAPDWAKNNYLMKFPVNFPSHLCEMTGIKRDFKRLEVARNEAETIIAKEQKSLEVMIATPNFNVNSYIQVRQLLKVLTGVNWTESDEAALKKAAFMHPLNGRILNKIVEIRQQRKLKSTYLRTDADISKQSPKGAKEYRGQILYSINPHGTDTGRNASKEHHFWCGLQIQNIPRGPSVKQTIIANDGFHFGESDLEQAEARDVGYLSGDENLIRAVSGDRDFHSINASAFFGVSYDTIYSDDRKKTLDKALRDLAKRVNHGSNYNMGVTVLILTMGEEAIWKAKILLKAAILSWLQRANSSKTQGQLELTYRMMGLREIAGYLLAVYEQTYPDVKGRWYDSIIHEVMTTSMLVGATGWTRYCFGKPNRKERKTDLNAYVAHAPQSLNAMVLDKAFMRVFYDIAINPEHRNNFKLLAQIHDSIFYMVRDGHEYLHQMVKERMEIPVTVKSSDGITRTFTVPAAVKCGTAGKPARYWSETE